MAVGQVVARSPGRIVEVGDMVVVGRGEVRAECRQLCRIAHQQYVGGCRIGGGGIVVEAFEIVRDGGGVSSYCGVVGIDDIGDEALLLFPLDEGVEVAAEHAVGHDDVAHRGGGADGFGVEVVQWVCTTVECRRIVALEHRLAGLFVAVAIENLHRGVAADDDLSAHRIVAHG